jgi:hypothetical protein
MLGQACYCIHNDGVQVKKKLEETSLLGRPRSRWVDKTKTGSELESADLG